MMQTSSKGTVLVLSQVYVPDPASVGQHMHDAAAEMASRGYRVVAFVANRGFQDPSFRYPSRETRDGVEIRRLPFSSFGKQSLGLRQLAGLSFVVQCALRGLFLRRLEGILVSTSPPMCGAAAWFLSLLRRSVGVTWWLMDLNPDQAVEMGIVRPGALTVRLLDWMNRQLLARAARVVTLDHLMADRIRRKGDVDDRLEIMPPWPHEDHIETIRHEANPFRDRHGLGDKLVLMYSGNHSPFAPLRTVIEAARRLRNDPGVAFVFVGAGNGKHDVDDAIAREGAKNMLSLPYQPLADIKYSLSAADVHLVVVGDKEVGLRHPCKVYGAMAASRPVLLVGPNPCHVSDLVRDRGIGWHVLHGDVDGVLAAIAEMRRLGPEKLAGMGERARREVTERFSRDFLRGKFCDVVEHGIAAARGD